MLTSTADKMAFGKHKGKTIAELLKSDPRYLLWLREERNKNNGDDFFSAGIDSLIAKANGKPPMRVRIDKKALESPRVLQEQFRILENEKIAAQQREEFYDKEWGEW